MLNRIPRNIPPLSTLLAELGATPRAVARVLQVSERTVRRWVRSGTEPQAVRIALFWLTRWGYSIINCDAENEARIFAGLARCRAEEIEQLQYALDNLSRIKKNASASNEAVFSRIDPSDSNTQCRK